ncbi:hypothetical protein NN561_017015 [Cricetulus griseus]
MVLCTGRGSVRGGGAQPERAGLLGERGLGRAGSRSRARWWRHVPGSVREGVSPALLGVTMAFTLYSLLQAALLCVNAIAVLHEERFLKNSECRGGGGGWELPGGRERGVPV